MLYIAPAGWLPGYSAAPIHVTERQDEINMHNLQVNRGWAKWPSHVHMIIDNRRRTKLLFLSVCRCLQVLHTVKHLFSVEERAMLQCNLLSIFPGRFEGHSAEIVDWAGIQMSTRSIEVSNYIWFNYVSKFSSESITQPWRDLTNRMQIPQDCCGDIWS